MNNNKTNTMTDDDDVLSVRFVQICPDLVCLVSTTNRKPSRLIFVADHREVTEADRSVLCNIMEKRIPVHLQPTYETVLCEIVNGAKPVSLRKAFYVICATWQDRLKALLTLHNDTRVFEQPVPKLYRKKPVTVQTVRFTGDPYSANAIRKFTNYTAEISADGNVYIPTLEGRMQASLGDWIIKGVDGEFYPCKPDIFDKTYEKV